MLRRDWLCFGRSLSSQVRMVGLPEEELVASRAVQDLPIPQGGGVSSVGHLACDVVMARQEPFGLLWLNHIKGH
jgi:hypothetical protein